ncbi:MAG: prepilin-type N-terminal cleavage/methylation domain-containing protein [Bacilli bacterium]|nr:prepilin-type N-terminal cleavage/methylation domain-containing protein [Bacilli bacterium]
MKKQTAKSKKKSLFKRFKGFTLVELLAVIVILAIIMIIAIPAVLNTLEASRKKTMVEFAQKVFVTGERKYLEDKSFNGMVNISRGNYYYSIKDDLDMSNTGDYDGYYILWVDGDILNHNILLWDKNYVLVKLYVEDHEITDQDVLSIGEYKQQLVSIAGEAFANEFGDFKTLNKEKLMYSLFLMADLDCNDEYDQKIYVVDASKPTESFNSCERFGN